MLTIKNNYKKYFRIIVVAVIISYLIDSGLLRAEKVLDYSGYAYLLQKYVNKSGLVDYEGMKKEMGKLDSFLDSINNLDDKEYEAWKEEDKIAFWINAYNAFTLKAIIDNYPLNKLKRRNKFYPHNSIRQIRGVWDKIKFDVKGEKLTLDHIEHQILRKQFKEPRIHMALVCAALGCPALRNEPYYGDKLDSQLANQTVIFLSGSGKFKIDKSKNKVFLSSIFKWFGGDFIDKYSSGVISKFSDEKNAVLNFISGYIEENDREYLIREKYKIKYLKYDWTLNVTE